MFNKHSFKTTLITYTIVSIFCIIFNFVYSYLGHGVISQSMRFAFIFPVIGAVFVYFWFYIFQKFSRIAFNLFNAGIATLAVGGLYQGVIDVAGADTTYGKYYTIIGVILIIASIFISFLSKNSRENIA